MINYLQNLYGTQLPPKLEKFIKCNNIKHIKTYNFLQYIALHHYDLLKLIIKNNKDLITSTEMQNIFMIYIEKCNYNMCKYLLKKGLNPNFVINNYKNPFAHVIEGNNNKKFIKLLLKYNASIILSGKHINIIFSIIHNSNIFKYIITHLRNKDNLYLNRFTRNNFLRPSQLFEFIKQLYKYKLFIAYIL